MITVASLARGASPSRLLPDPPAGLIDTLLLFFFIFEAGTKCGSRSFKEEKRSREPIECATMWMRRTPPPMIDLMNSTKSGALLPSTNAFAYE